MVLSTHRRVSALPSESTPIVDDDEDDDESQQKPEPQHFTTAASAKTSERMSLTGARIYLCWKNKKMAGGVQARCPHRLDSCERRSTHDVVNEADRKKQTDHPEEADVIV